jgi:L-fuconolactonase
MRNGSLVVDAHVHISCGTPAHRVSGAPARPFDVEDVMRAFESAGVDRGVLVQNPSIGMMNDEVLEACRRHPDRFLGAVQVDPCDRDGVATFERYAQQPGMRLLKLEMSQGGGWTGIHAGLRLDGREIFALLDAAPPGYTIVIDTGPIGTRGYQPEAIDRLADRFPHLSFLVEHLGYLTLADLGDSGHLSRWRQLIALAKRANLYFGLSAACILMDDTHPGDTSLKYVRIARDIASADKLIWGSDIPGTLVRYEYRQMLDAVLERADFLSGHERCLVAGVNALQLLWGEGRQGRA